MKEPRQNRRDLLLILLLVPLGMLCMFITGQMAIQLKPLWQLEADLRSLLNPTANFVVNDEGLYEPVEPFIPPPQRNPGGLLGSDAIVPTNVFIVISTPVHKEDTPVPTSGIITPVLTPPPTPTIGGPIIVPTSPGPSMGDLVITKTDSSNTYTPGAPIQYTIVVTNRGPDSAPKFDVIDNVPANITNLTVGCSPAIRCGTNTSNGNNISFTGASLFRQQEGVYQLTITISGTVASGASGDLSNTASVIAPNNSRFRDPRPNNNTVTDTDTQLSIYDLAITKSDGANTYTATNPLTYTVVVTNNGPSDAVGVRVVDNIPPQITSWSWTCVMANASGCNNAGTNNANNFADTVNIQSGGNIEYTVTANPAGGIAQSLSNTASINLPTGSTAIDPDLSNNTATDTDIPYIDLQVTKDDSSDTYAANGSVIYTVTVTNNSTFDVNGITISDPKPGRITDWDWCIGPPCPPNFINTDFTDTIDLAAGSSLAYTVTANISGNTNPGNLTNTATVSVPAGLVEAVPADNSATDVDAPDIDLSILKNSVGASTYSAGDTITYQITVTNNSTFNLTGITVSDPKADMISTWDWVCSTPNPSCTPSSGLTSDFSDSIDLTSAESIQYDVTATIVGGPGDTIVPNLVNEATVSMPAGLSDSNPGNNTSSVTHTSTAPPEINVGPPDGNVISPPAGSIYTLFISPAITNNNDPAAPDFVFFERDTGSGIALDTVIIELSADGTTWTQVFNWGDNNPDTNSNVSAALGPVCGGTEYDDCPIPPSYLYSSNGFATGVTIDIDSLGLSGSYPWIRFTCPIAGNTDNYCDIDSILPNP